MGGPPGTITRDELDRLLSGEAAPPSGVSRPSRPGQISRAQLNKLLRSVPTETAAATGPGPRLAEPARIPQTTEIFESLEEFAKSRGFRVTSTVRTHLDPRGVHVRGQAIDVGIHEKSRAEIESFEREAEAGGAKVLRRYRWEDGRLVARGGADTGPHLHLELEREPFIPPPTKEQRLKYGAAARFPEKRRRLIFLDGNLRRDRGSIKHLESDPERLQRSGRILALLKERVRRFQREANDLRGIKGIGIPPLEPGGVRIIEGLAELHGIVPAEEAADLIPGFWSAIKSRTPEVAFNQWGRALYQIVELPIAAAGFKHSPLLTEETREIGNLPVGERFKTLGAGLGHMAATAVTRWPSPTDPNFTDAWISKVFTLLIVRGAAGGLSKVKARPTTIAGFSRWLTDNTTLTDIHARAVIETGIAETKRLLQEARSKAVQEPTAAPGAPFVPEPPRPAETVISTRTGQQRTVRHYPSVAAARSAIRAGEVAPRELFTATLRDATRVYRVSKDGKALVTPTTAKGGAWEVVREAEPVVEAPRVAPAKPTAPVAPERPAAAPEGTYRSKLDQRITDLEGRRKGVGKGRERGAADVGPEDFELLALRAARMILDGADTAPEIAQALGVSAKAAGELKKAATTLLQDETYFQGFKFPADFGAAERRVVERVLGDIERTVNPLEELRTRGAENVTGMTLNELNAAALRGFTKEQIVGMRTAAKEAGRQARRAEKAGDVEEAAEFRRVEATLIRLYQPELSKGALILRESQQTPPQALSYQRLLTEADDIARNSGMPEAPEQMTRRLSEIGGEADSLYDVIGELVRKVTEERTARAEIEKALKIAKRTYKRGARKEAVDRMKVRRDEAIARLSIKFGAENPMRSGLPELLLDAETIRDVSIVVRYHILKGVDTVAGLIEAVARDVKSVPEATVREAVMKGVTDELRLRGAEQTKKTKLGETGEALNEIARMRDRLRQLSAEARSEMNRFNLHTGSLEQRAVKYTLQVLGEVWEIPRTLLATADQSVSFIQLWPINWGEAVISPRTVGRNLKNVWSTFWSRDFTNRLLASIETHPEYFKWVQDGGGIERATSAARSEFFMSRFVDWEFRGEPKNWIQKALQRIGKANPLSAAERSFVAGGTAARFHYYTRGLEFMERIGMPQEQIAEARKTMVDRIDTLTGAGRLEAWGTLGKGLQKGFFSGRMMKTQIYTTNPLWYATLPKGLRRLMIVDMAKNVALSYLIYSMAKQANRMGADVDAVMWPPDAPEFGKLRVGDRRYSLFGQRETFIRHAWASAANFFGQEGSEYKASERLGSYFLRRLHPAISGSKAILTERDVLGREVERWEAVLNSMSPIYIQELRDAYEAGSEEDRLAIALMLAAPSFFGVASARYQIRDPRSAKFGSELLDVPLPDEIDDDLLTPPPLPEID